MKTPHRFHFTIGAGLALALAGLGCTSVLGDVTFDRSTGGGGSGGTGGATSSSSSSSSSSGAVQCAAGEYEYPPGSGTCIDDPCKPNPCDHHGLCTNDTGSAVCNCVYFVDDAATGASNGDTWTDAFTTIRAALTAADQQVQSGAPSCDVWVKKGTYYVYDASDQDNGIDLRTNVGVYGGFAGGETLRSQAAPQTNETILIGRDKTNNALQVKHVVAAYDVQNASIDGFTIREGYASGGTPEQGKGGGVMIYVFNAAMTSVAVSRCDITANSALSGGGIGVQVHNGKTTSLTVTDCDIHENSSTFGGGGLACDEMLCSVAKTKIRSNTAAGAAGAPRSVRSICTSAPALRASTSATARRPRTSTVPRASERRTSAPTRATEVVQREAPAARRADADPQRMTLS